MSCRRGSKLEIGLGHRYCQNYARVAQYLQQRNEPQETDNADDTDGTSDTDDTYVIDDSELDEARRCMEEVD